MQNVVSFSGGRTSAYLVWLMVNLFPYLNTKFIFCDTGAEHPKTYEFIKRLVKEWGVDLVCLRPVINPELNIGPTWERIDVSELKFDLTVMKKLMNKHGNFTIGRPHCTERLKTVVSDKYCDETFGKKNWIKWLGMRIDEPRRLKIKKQMHYLADISDFEKPDVLSWWKKQPFDLEIPEHLGNCVFCVKKNKWKLVLAARDEPELFEEWSAAVEDEENVRLMPSDEHGIGRIYREWLSPSMLIASTSDVPTEHIRERIYKGKMDDANSCSESCEAY